MQKKLKIVQKKSKNAKNCTKKCKHFVKSAWENQKLVQLWKTCTSGATAATDFFHLWTGSAWPASPSSTLSGLKFSVSKVVAFMFIGNLFELQWKLHHPLNPPFPSKQWILMRSLTSFTLAVLGCNDDACLDCPTLHWILDCTATADRMVKSDGKSVLSSLLSAALTLGPRWWIFSILQCLWPAPYGFTWGEHQTVLTFRVLQKTL